MEIIRAVIIKLDVCPFLFADAQEHDGNNDADRVSNGSVVNGRAFSSLGIQELAEALVAQQEV